MPAIELRRVTEAHLPALQKIFDESPEYFLKTEGTIAASNAASETISSLPPGTSLSQKFVFLAYLKNTPIGVIDLIDGYPDSETAFLGLLLINEGLHRTGLGSQTYLAVEEFVSKNTVCKKIRLAVIESNPVVPFWRKMGFELTGESKPHDGKKVKSRKLLMEKSEFSASFSSKKEETKTENSAKSE